VRKKAKGRRHKGREEMRKWGNEGMIK